MSVSPQHSTTQPNSRLNQIAQHVISSQSSSSSSNASASSDSISSKFTPWAHFYPADELGTNRKLGPVLMENFVNGKWVKRDSSESTMDLIDPLYGASGKILAKLPLTDGAELEPYLKRMSEVPKGGLHNPMKRVERYVQYGELSFQLAKALDDPHISDHFTKLIIRCVPKSYPQAFGEVMIVKKFLQNFSGDQVRFLARGFSVSGDHEGQESKGYRWPFGAVCIIAPFNFPLEIPILQLMGALYMGNHVTIKGSEKASLVLEEWIRLMIFLSPKGSDSIVKNDINLIHGIGSGMKKLVDSSVQNHTLRAMQFTGSNKVAQELCKATSGKVKIEDAGFNWKILGPDVDGNAVDFVAFTSDQDAYANCGQKCSAQSLLVVHENWMKSDVDLLGKLKSLASKRNLKDLSLAPVLTFTTEQILGHCKEILTKVPGSKLLWGGKALDKSSHSIPACYGAVEPTAVYVPLKEFLNDNGKNYSLITKEIFGPFQIVTSWKGDSNNGSDSSSDIPTLLHILDKMDNHLTAAISTNNIQLQQLFLKNTVNGTTYCGIKARTTGAPQNHWFGPSSDPRAAGIGSPEAIKLVWSGHREVIMDVGRGSGNMVGGKQS